MNDHLKTYELNFLREAYRHAFHNATDPSTQNGAIIISTDGRGSYGANHFPKNVVESTERWKRPLKYQFVEHAERNAIYAAAKEGIPTEGATMYCPWAACTDCMRGIIQCGIKKLVTHHNPLADTRFGQPVSDLWKESIKIALEMLRESGVELVYYDDKLFDESFEYRFNGIIVNP